MQKNRIIAALLALAVIETTFGLGQPAIAVPGDTAGPMAISSSMSKSAVEVGTTSDTFDLTLHITDESGFASGSISCILPGGSSEIYSNLGYSPVDGWYAIGPQGQSLKSASGTQQDATITVEMQANYGIFPGTLDCYLWAYDTPFGNMGFSRLGQIDVIRTGTGYDDASPVLESYSYSKPFAEVGTTGDLVTVSLRVTDQTGFDRGQFTCLDSVTNTLVSFTQIYAPLQTNFYSTTRITWSANDIQGNQLPFAATGNNQDATLVFAMPIPFGTNPGVVRCSLLSSDRLEHIGTSGAGTFSVFHTPPGLPAQPEQLTVASVSSVDATVTWQSPANVGTPPLSGYLVQYSTDGSSWVNVPNGITAEHSVSVSGLQSDTDYWFRVRGDNSVTTGSDTTFMNLGWASTKLHTNPTTVPNAPSGLISSGVSASGFTLDWSEPVNNVGSPTIDYIVEASTDNGATWTSLENAVSTSTHLAVTSAVPGTTYLIRIAAVNSLGRGTYLTGTVRTQSVTPDAPQNLRYLNLAGTSLTLQWDAPISDGGSALTDYNVDVSSDSGITWNAISHTSSTNPTIIVQNLHKNQSYQFRVTAVNAVGAGSQSNVIVVTTPATVASAPNGVAIINTTSSSATIAWQAPIDDGGALVTDYKIEISSDSGSNWVEVTHIPSPATSVAASGLAAGVQYTVRVSAKNSMGYGATVSGTFKTLNGQPSVPTMLAPTNVSSTALILNWSAPFSNGGQAITDYKIEMSVNCSTFSNIRHDRSTALSFKVTNLAAGTKYCFRISAVNALGTSTPSNVATQVTIGNAPNAPTNLSAKNIKIGGFTLSWTQASVYQGSAVRDYLIEYSADNGLTWKVWPKQPSTATAMSITGLTSKTAYLFRVKAVNDVGASLASAALKVAIP